jgi:hypothetical protein
VCAGAVVGMTAWRIVQPRIRAGQDVGFAPGIAGAVASAAVLLLALGPFKVHTKPWNAANFSDTLTGNISRRATAIRGIVSLAGAGSGQQRVLVRADLLLAPAHLLDTSFQMEYLPSGDVCRGRVDQVTEGGLGFSATCSMKDGRTRSVQASWDGGEGSAISGGTLESSD